MLLCLEVFMSILSVENKCLFKAACALAFLLVLILTACDATETSSPTEIGDLSCDDCMEVDGKWTRTLDDFQKCNAKNEGLVDSTVFSGSTTKVAFYTCENNEWVWDVESTWDASLRDFEPDMPCDESYEIDGAYYEVLSEDYGFAWTRYFKCENNKWSLLPKENELPDSAKVILTRDRHASPNFSSVMFKKILFKKCNAENEGLIDSAYSTDYSYASLKYNAVYARYHVGYEIYYKCEQGTWNEVPASSVCDVAGKAIFCEDFDPSSLTETSAERDSAYCDTLTVATPPYKCNESLQIDEHYYHFSGYAYPGLGGCTFKCQHNEWSFVPAKDVPEDAKMFSDNDVVYRTEEIGMLNFKKCSAENEGIVDSLTTGNINPKGGNARVYYRCEQENWVESPAWVACDTTGVNEGDLCRLQTSFRGIQFGSDTWECYKYAGSGTWEEQDCEEPGDDSADSSFVQEE